jgi:hypothetical protein
VEKLESIQQILHAITVKPRQSRIATVRLCLELVFGWRTSTLHQAAAAVTQSEKMMKTLMMTENIIGLLQIHWPQNNPRGILVPEWSRQLPTMVIGTVYCPVRLIKWYLQFDVLHSLL